MRIIIERIDDERIVFREGDTMIAIAYLDQNENGFTDSEPWIDKWNGNWRKRVSELIQTGYKNVTPFHIDDDLESYTWEYISKHKITNS